MLKFPPRRIITTCSQPFLLSIGLASRTASAALTISSHVHPMDCFTKTSRRFTSHLRGLWVGAELPRLPFYQLHQRNEWMLLSALLCSRPDARPGKWLRNAGHTFLHWLRRSAMLSSLELRMILGMVRAPDCNSRRTSTTLPDGYPCGRPRRSSLLLARSSVTTAVFLTSLLQSVHLP